MGMGKKFRKKIVLTQGVQDSLYDGTVGAYNALVANGVIVPVLDDGYNDVALNDAIVAVSKAFARACAKAYSSDAEA